MNLQNSVNWPARRRVLHGQKMTMVDHLALINLTINICLVISEDVSVKVFL